MTYWTCGFRLYCGPGYISFLHMGHGRVSGYVLDGLVCDPIGPLFVFFIGSVLNRLRAFRTSSSCRGATSITSISSVVVLFLPSSDVQCTSFRNTSWFFFWAGNGLISSKYSPYFSMR